jgi:hypothetical protein
MTDADGRAVAQDVLAGPVQDGLRLVQYNAVPSAQQMQALELQGCRILGALPHNALIVSRPGDVATALANLDGVRWTGPYVPDQRITPRLAGALERLPDLGPDDIVNVRVFFHPAAYLDSCLAAVSALGSVGACGRNTDAVYVEAAVPRKSLDRLTRVEWVLTVDYAPRPRLYNNEAAGIIDVRTTWNTRGFMGSNEVIAIADSGFDLGTTGTTVHADFQDGSGGSRVLKLYDIAGDGPQDDASGHGTHVAGTALGNGRLSGAVPTNNFFPSTCYAGMAPKASLLFQAMGLSIDPNGVYPPANLGDLLRPVYNDGARVHNNSWGVDAFGEYTDQSRQIDEFCFFHPEMLVCISAGNAGRDTSPTDGIIDNGSVGAPASAKNCVTVGASENLRPGITTTYGSANPTRFPIAPIAPDAMTDDTNGIAASSSRGPCYDGRIKPDVVTPGTYVISTRTHAISPGSILGGSTSNTNYVYCSGSSMSSPQVAGVAAVMREYLRVARGITNPPAALLKAMLVNGALDLAPGQYGSVTQELSQAPDNAQGWGLVQVDSALYGDGAYLMELCGHDASFAGPGSFVTNVTVYDTNMPLRVNLAWSDFPGSTWSVDTGFSQLGAGGLVNDLDLRVIGPAGVTNYPRAMDPRCNIFYYTNQANYSYLTWTGTGAAEAVKCTAPAVPMTITNLELLCHNGGGPAGTIRAAVWAANGPGGTPGSLLYSSLVAVSPVSGLKIYVIPASVAISSSNFYIGVIVEDTDISAARDTATSTARSWYFNGASWARLPAGYGGDMWMHAYGVAATGDHVNTIEGVVVDSPQLGSYTIVVSGDNVPYGPVTFGVAASGGLAPEPAAGFLCLGLAFLAARRRAVPRH